MPTFQTFTFGCRVNIAETETIRQSLLSNNFIETDNNPDFYIINSCAVTGKSEREVRQHIHRVRNNYPIAKIIVTGCAATRWMENKLKVSEVDEYIPNISKFEIANICLAHFNKSQIPNSLPSPRLRVARNIQKNINYQKFIQPKIIKQNKYLSSGRVFIKIQDGCFRFCSFCIVPHLRGKPSTKTSYEIINEINSYGDKISETILTGINTEYFGKGNGESLTKLIDEVLKNTNIKRLSFGSIHPWSVNNEFINWYKMNAGNPRFVHFFHIPIQSGSDEILKLMNRGYKSNEMMEKLNMLRSINPDALIGTDVIVGFPGETEQMFRETYDFLEKSPIDKFHVFRYSERSGTRAASFDNNIIRVSPEDKKKRSQKLISLSNSKMKIFQKKFLGRTLPAILLVEYDSGYQSALLPNQLIVQIRTKIQLPASQIHEVFLTKFQSGILRGKI